MLAKLLFLEYCNTQDIITHILIESLLREKRTLYEIDESNITQTWHGKNIKDF
jgi:hypothetical protein